jgi:hypothetical protein
VVVSMARTTPPKEDKVGTSSAGALAAQALVAQEVRCQIILLMTISTF